MLYGIAKPIAVALMRVTCGLEVHGREHVPAEGPLLVVSNHVSVLDPPFVGGACPRELYYLAKEELFAVPLFGCDSSRSGCALSAASPLIPPSASADSFLSAAFSSSSVC